MRISVINGEEETRLYQTELEHWSRDIYTTRIGMLSLRKLDFDIYHDKSRKEYWLVKMTPIVKTLINQNKQDVLFKGRSISHLKMKVVIFLRQIPKAGSNIPLERYKFEFLGCMLIRDGEVIDSREIIFGDKL
jgi:hypothetical protein